MRIAVLAAMALGGATLGAQAQTAMDHSAMAHGQSASLIQPGQSAFAAIQEVVERLQADPNTDWSTIHIDALREHLIDMEEVTLRATIRAEPTATGVRYSVTGGGRTREAIQRMVMGHARSMGDAEHWSMSASEIPEGVLVTVTPKQPSDMPRIQALGLLGMMSDGAHHQPHHWFLATGEAPMGR